MNAQRHFLVVGYPRSRTAWLANWLCHGGVHCGHELLARCVTPEEYLHERFVDSGRNCAFSGSAETAAALWMPQLAALLRGAPIVLVSRPEAEVARSLERLGLDGDVRWAREGLEYARRLPQTLEVRFADLDSEATARAILAHVAPGEPLDWPRWRMLREFNVQITPRRMEQLGRNAEQNAAALGESMAVYKGSHEDTKTRRGDGAGSNL